MKTEIFERSRTLADNPKTSETGSKLDQKPARYTITVPDDSPRVQYTGRDRIKEALVDPVQTAYVNSIRDK